MPEAMKKIRNELGKDAVILNSKVVNKGGVLGFFMKKNIEVIAAVDTEPSRPVSTSQKPKPKSSNLVEKPSPFPDRPVSRQQVKDLGQSGDAEVKKEIQHLKKLLSDIGPDLITSEQFFPDPLKKVQDVMLDQEVDKKVVRHVMTSLYEKWVVNNKLADQDLLVQWAADILSEHLGPIPFGELAYDKQYVNVIGPTGVGKTTTLAKIAARCVINDKKQVAFITTDTYRIAAIEQLKTYAAILGIPVEVAYNMDDFKEAKEKFKHKDVVFIDTAGRNYRNSEYVNELKSVLDFNHDTETFLVLSLTSKLRDMKAIYDQFNMIDINKFIFTKADETTSFGSILTMVTEYDTGVAYITNGQNVPDDILPGSIDTIIEKLLLGDE